MDAGRDSGTHDGAEPVDLAAERARRGGAYRIPCARCGAPVHEHATRCTRCGVWFDGEAYEFAERVRARGRAWRAARLALYVLLALGALSGLLLALG